MIAFLRSPAAPEARPRKPEPGGFDVVRASAQHASIGAVLAESGVQLHLLTPSPGVPASCCVAREAILLPELAIATRPHAAAPATERQSVARALAEHRPIQSIVAPAALNGQDIVRIGRTLFGAETADTDAEGIGQLRDIAAAFGYAVETVALRGGVHLHSACSFIRPHFLVANPAWVDPQAFGNVVIVPVDEKEPLAADTLTLPNKTLVSASGRKTEKRLREIGIITAHLDVSEFERMGAGLSSLCLLLEPRSAHRPPAELTTRPVVTTSVPAPVAHYSQAVVHAGLVFVSLQLPTTLHAPAEQQMREVIRNLALVLSASGSSLARTLSTTVHVADPKYLARMEPIYQEMFGANRPARSIQSNVSLPDGALIGISAVAALGDGPA